MAKWIVILGLLVGLGACSGTGGPYTGTTTGGAAAGY